MGWASGSELAERVWGEVREFIPDDKRKNVANEIIDAFEDMDCDTIDECEQLVKDAERPEYCWDCGDEVPFGGLDDHSRCKKCQGKV